MHGTSPQSPTFIHYITLFVESQYGYHKVGAMYNKSHSNPHTPFITSLIRSLTTILITYLITSLITSLITYLITSTFCVSGEGCRRCSVGFLCTFELRFSSNFYFWFKGKENPEVMITLSGMWLRVYLCCLYCIHVLVVLASKFEVFISNHRKCVKHTFGASTSVTHANTNPPLAWYIT